MKDLLEFFSRLPNLKKKVIELFLSLVRSVLNNEFQYLLQPSLTLLHSPFMKTSELIDVKCSLPTSDSSLPCSTSGSSSSSSSSAAVSATPIQSNSVKSGAAPDVGVGESALQPSKFHGSFQSISATAAAPYRVPFPSYSSYISGLGNERLNRIPVGTDSQLRTMQNPGTNANTVTVTTDNASNAQSSQSRGLRSFDRNSTAGSISQSDEAQRVNISATASVQANATQHSHQNVPAVVCFYPNSTRPPQPPDRLIARPDTAQNMQARQNTITTDTTATGSKSTRPGGAVTSSTSGKSKAKNSSFSTDLSATEQSTLVNILPQSTTVGIVMGTSQNTDNVVSKKVNTAQPQSFKEFVQRSFAQCCTDSDRAYVQSKLKNFISKVAAEGRTMVHRWDLEPCPRLPPDRLIARPDTAQNMHARRNTNTTDKHVAATSSNSSRPPPPVIAMVQPHIGGQSADGKNTSSSVPSSSRQRPTQNTSVAPTLEVRNSTTPHQTSSAVGIRGHSITELPNATAAVVTDRIPPPPRPPTGGFAWKGFNQGALQQPTHEADGRAQTNTAGHSRQIAIDSAAADSSNSRPSQSAVSQSHFADRMLNQISTNLEEYAAGAFSFPNLNNNSFGPPDLLTAIDIGNTNTAHQHNNLPTIDSSSRQNIIQPLTTVSSIGNVAAGFEFQFNDETRNSRFPQTNTVNNPGRNLSDSEQSSQPNMVQILQPSIDCSSRPLSTVAVLEGVAEGHHVDDIEGPAISMNIEVPCTMEIAQQPGEFGTETSKDCGMDSTLSTAKVPPVVEQNAIDYDNYCGVSIINKPRLNRRRSFPGAEYENPSKRLREEAKMPEPTSSLGQEIAPVTEQCIESVALLLPPSAVTDDQNLHTSSFSRSSCDEHFSAGQSLQQNSYQTQTQTLTRSQERVCRYEWVERYVTETTLEGANDTSLLQTSNHHDAIMPEVLNNLPARDVDQQFQSFAPPLSLQQCYPPRLGAESSAGGISVHTNTAISSHTEKAQGGGSSQELSCERVVSYSTAPAALQSEPQNPHSYSLPADFQNQRWIPSQSVREVRTSTLEQRHRANGEGESTGLFQRENRTQTVQQLPTPLPISLIHDLYRRQKLDNDFFKKMEPLNREIDRLKRERQLAGSDHSKLHVILQNLLVYKTMRDEAMHEHQRLLEQQQPPQSQPLQYSMHGSQLAHFEPPGQQHQYYNHPHYHPHYHHHLQQQQPPQRFAEHFAPSGPQPQPQPQPQIHPQLQIMQPQQHSQLVSTSQYPQHGQYPRPMMQHLPQRQHHSGALIQQQHHHHGQPPAVPLQPQQGLQYSYHHPGIINQYHQGQPQPQQQLQQVNQQYPELTVPSARQSRLDYSSNSGSSSSNIVNENNTKYFSSGHYTSDSSSGGGQAKLTGQSNRVAANSSSSSSNNNNNNNSNNSNRSVYHQRDLNYRTVRQQGQGALAPAESFPVVREIPNSVHHYRSRKQSSATASGKPSISRLILDNLAEG